jgi:hypothetical protein
MGKVKGRASKGSQSFRKAAWGGGVKKYLDSRRTTARRLSARVSRSRLWACELERTGHHASESSSYSLPSRQAGPFSSIPSASERAASEQNRPANSEIFQESWIVTKECMARSVVMLGARRCLYRPCPLLCPVAAWMR